MEPSRKFCLANDDYNYFVQMPEYDYLAPPNCSLKHVTPRFQLLTCFLHFDDHQKYKPLNLFGHITIYNGNVNAASSSSLTYERGDHGVSIIFKRPSFDPMPIVNKHYLFPLHGLPTHRSIPVYNSLDILVDLTAVTLDDDDDDKVYVQLRNDPKDFKLLVKYDTICKHLIKGPHGFLDLSYIILTNPVEADLEITFLPDFDVSARLFSITISAFYGNNYGPFKLLDKDPATLNGKISLTTSSLALALPATGKLVIRATIYQVEGDPHSDVSMSQDLQLTTKLKGSSTGCIHGEYCRLQVKVNWKYEATEQNDIATDEIYTCKKCEDVIQHLKECEDLKSRKKILMKIMKLRTKKQRMKRMNVNWKYTEDDELELESLQLRLSKLNVA